MTQTIQPPRPPKLPSTPVRSKRKQRRPKTKKPFLKGRLPIRRELSAGGVAARKEGEQWLVAILQTEHKRGKVWVLPKGHVELDQNEKIPDAARREVSEEAGITDLSVKDQLGISRFSFRAETATVQKTVHYFLMITNQKELIPQAEEGMLDAKWLPIDEAIEVLEYDTDQDVVIKAREKLTGQKPPRRPRRNIKIRL